MHQLSGGWHGKVSAVASPAGREDGLHPALGAGRANPCPVRDLPLARLHLSGRPAIVKRFYKEVYMVKSLIAICAMAGMLGLSACSGMGKGETVGTAGGAVAGGALGS